MPDNRIQLIVTLQPEVRQQACPVLLDANAVDDFLEWLKDNPDIERQFLENNTYRIEVLMKHLNQRHDWKDEKDRNGEVRKRGLASRLKLLKIEASPYTATRDELLVDELQRAYFGNDATARKSAELLAFGRRRSSDERPVRVISRHSGFRAVPGVDLYVFDLDEIGIESDAILLREFASLNLHRKVVEAAFEHVKNENYPMALLHTVNNLYTEMRSISGCPDDGKTLIDQTLGANAPIIQLTTLASQTERNEQKGYAEFAYGAQNALRDVLSHRLAEKEFIRKRFGDRRTALKFLCLLSLVFERLEDRVAPW